MPFSMLERYCWIEGMGWRLWFWFGGWGVGGGPSSAAIFDVSSTVWVRLGMTECVGWICSRVAWGRGFGSGVFEVGGGRWK